MAAETVALVPDYACNREVISNFVDGVLFTPMDENDLSDKIICLSENPEELRLIGLQARINVKENYTWADTWGKAMMHIVDRIGASCK
jgi:glycosyltransferase involved in cell wall biosynthesis